LEWDGIDMQSEAEVEVTESCGNVFADLGLPDAEELQAKVRLGVAICRVVDHDKLTQAQVAALLGINQPKVSALVNYKLEGFSVERLMRFLLKLGHDVEIVVKAKPKSRAARIAVKAA
jgi:predicted XRE-type DNA-binding protein